MQILVSKLFSCVVPIAYVIPIILKQKHTNKLVWCQNTGKSNQITCVRKLSGFTFDDIPFFRPKKINFHISIQENSLIELHECIKFNLMDVTGDLLCQLILKAIVEQCFVLFSEISSKKCQSSCVIGLSICCVQSIDLAQDPESPPLLFGQWGRAGDGYWVSGHPWRLNGELLSRGSSSSDFPAIC